MNEIIKPITRLAERMQFKLDSNKDKDCDIMNPENKGRGWKHCTSHWLLKRAREEISELEDALMRGNIDDILNECGDVGNFLMMIFDNCRQTTND